MSEEIKKDDLQEEVEATETEETVEEVIEEIPEKSELELANERADEFENKYLRAHAEMQNIQRRSSEERQQLQRHLPAHAGCVCNPEPGPCTVQRKGN